VDGPLRHKEGPKGRLVGEVTKVIFINIVPFPFSWCPYIYLDFATVW
jgi:hypothetical protein